MKTILHFIDALHRQAPLEELHSITKTFEYSSDKPGQRAVEEFLISSLKNNDVMVPYQGMWHNHVQSIDNGEPCNNILLNGEKTFLGLMLLSHLLKEQNKHKKYHPSIEKFLQSNWIYSLCLGNFYDLNFILQKIIFKIYAQKNGVSSFPYEQWIHEHFDILIPELPLDHWKRHALLPWGDDNVKKRLVEYFIHHLDGSPLIAFIQQKLCYQEELLPHIDFLKNHHEIQEYMKKDNYYAWMLRLIVLREVPPLEHIFKQWIIENRKLNMQPYMYNAFNQYFEQNTVTVSPELRRDIFTYLFKHQVKREKHQPCLHWFGIHLTPGFFVSEVNAIMKNDYGCTATMRERAELHNLLMHHVPRDMLFKEVDNEIRGNIQLPEAETTLFI